jgi:hypothetical protein
VGFRLGCRHIDDFVFKLRFQHQPFLTTTTKHCSNTLTVSRVVPSFSCILVMMRVTRWPLSFRKLIFSVTTTGLPGGGMGRVPSLVLYSRTSWTDSLRTTAPKHGNTTKRESNAHNQPCCQSQATRPIPVPLEAVTWSSSSSEDSSQGSCARRHNVVCPCPTQHQLRFCRACTTYPALKECIENVLCSFERNFGTFTARWSLWLMYGPVIRLIVPKVLFRFGLIGFKRRFRDVFARIVRCTLHWINENFICLQDQSGRWRFGSAAADKHNQSQVPNTFP